LRSLQSCSLAKGGVSMCLRFSVLAFAAFAGTTMISAAGPAGPACSPQPVSLDQIKPVCLMSNTIDWHDDANKHIREEFTVGYLTDPKKLHVLHLFQHEWRYPIFDLPIYKKSPGWKDCGQVETCWPLSGFTIKACILKPDTHDYDRIVRDPAGSTTVSHANKSGKKSNASGCRARFHEHDHDTQLSCPVYEPDDTGTYPTSDQP
jgi:hypothetical protein